MSILKIPKLKHLKSNNFVLIAGPCVIENEALSLEIASKISAISDKLEIHLSSKEVLKSKQK